MSFFINFICRINPCNPNFLLDRAQETILAGDIGGTNTRFTIYQVNRDDPEVKKGLSPGALAPGSKLFEMKYLNHEYPSFVDVLQKFLLEAKVKKPPVTACFAVAGPVSDNKVTFTNRASWSIDGALIETELGIQKVRLINDFLAVGYGLLTLDEEVECICLQVSQIPHCLGVLLYSALTLSCISQRGKRNLSSPIACIGAGTGLGECFLAPDNDGTYLCFPSEGGHADFAPRGPVEEGLLQYLKEKFKQAYRVSVERVVSGTGLVNIYEYLAATRPAEVDAEIQKKVDEDGELAGATIATNTQNAICRDAMQLFASVCSLCSRPVPSIHMNLKCCYIFLRW